MTLTQKLLGVASLGLAFVTASFAQQANADSASLLGVRYVEASFGYLDINHSNIDAFTVGADINIPVTAYLDLGVGYSHDWVENNESLYGNVASVSATGYLTEGAWRSFVTVELGHVWDSTALGGDDYGYWDVGVGAEYSFNAQTALAALVSYGDDFDGGDNHSIAGSVRVSHWFTSALAGTAGVTWFEHGTFGYGVSAIFKF